MQYQMLDFQTETTKTNGQMMGSVLIRIYCWSDLLVWSGLLVWSDLLV